MWLAGKSPINGDCNWKMAHFQLPCLITGGYLEFVSMCVYIYTIYCHNVSIKKLMFAEIYSCYIVYIYMYKIGSNKRSNDTL